MKEPHSAIATSAQKAPDPPRRVVVVYVQAITVVLPADCTLTALGDDEELEVSERKTVLTRKVLIPISHPIFRTSGSSPPPLEFAILLGIAALPVLRLADIGIAIGFVVLGLRKGKSGRK